MKFVFTLIGLIILSSCSKNSVDNENCKFLLDLNVNVTVNLSLPQYSQLPFAGNSVYIANAGNAGIIVASTGADFFAWDAADPNHIPSACSVLIPSGLNATCGCDDENEYNLVTGRALGSNNLPCSLKNYRVEQNGNSLLIFN
ncbi:hypothetical protein Q4Q35_20550 [Flavivirga aquimarina]|uniref:Rieske domain-containing protein n=1 Tax=Flavivirga aquimarina TaxID=2027862 RepID=A0ABT8WGF4_9FLAO|nr:hypothetical protein [Flavivirga aquimarina]MDO5972196.1 hypothetical protein [Flavivirga aquimarina]